MKKSMERLGKTKGNVQRRWVSIISPVLLGLLAITFVTGCPVFPPEPPTNLRATAVSSSEISLTWTKTSGHVSGFIVERSESQDQTDFMKIAVTSADTTTVIDGGLSPATDYWYRVRAYNTRGESSNSNIATATTQPSSEVPDAPSNLIVTATSTSAIVLSWSDNSDNESGFRIERSTTSGSSGFIELSTVGAGVQMYTDIGLSAGTTYWYRVCSYNDLGNSQYASADPGTTNNEATVPDAPSSLVATATSSSAVDLSWSDNSDNESGFRIERSTTSGSAGFTGLSAVGAGVATYTDTGLSAGTTYWYRVCAYNSEGDSLYSNVVPVTPPFGPSMTVSAASLSFTAVAGGANPAAQLFTVTNGGGETLNWKANESLGWLSLSPMSGATAGGESDTVTVSVNASGYAAGTYSGYITVSADNAANSPQTISVALTVNSPPQPWIALSTSSISATAIEGSNPPSQTFTVRNSGTGTLVYLVSDNREWMTCTLIDGDGKSTGESETIRVDFLASSLAAGTYTGQIRVHNDFIFIVPIGSSEAPAANSPQTISVSLTIDPPPSPPNINHLYEFGIEEWPGGNNNGLANVGEWVKVQFRFRNNGGQTAHNIITTLQISVFDYNYCYIADKTVARGILSPGLSKRSEHNIYVSAVPPDGYYDFVIQIDWDDAEGNSYSDVFGVYRVRVYP